MWWMCFGLHGEWDDGSESDSVRTALVCASPSKTNHDCLDGQCVNQSGGESASGVVLVH